MTSRRELTAHLPSARVALVVAEEAARWPLNIPEAEEVEGSHEEEEEDSIRPGSPDREEVGQGSEAKEVEGVVGLGLTKVKGGGPETTMALLDNVGATILPGGSIATNFRRGLVTRSSNNDSGKATSDKVIQKTELEVGTEVAATGASGRETNVRKDSKSSATGRGTEAAGKTTNRLKIGEDPVEMVAAIEAAIEGLVVRAPTGQTHLEDLNRENLQAFGRETKEGEALETPFKASKANRDSRSRICQPRKVGMRIASLPVPTQAQVLARKETLEGREEMRPGLDNRACGTSRLRGRRLISQRTGLHRLRHGQDKEPAPRPKDHSDRGMASGSSREVTIAEVLSAWQNNFPLPANTALKVLLSGSSKMPWEEEGIGTDPLRIQDSSQEMRRLHRRRRLKAMET